MNREQSSVEKLSNLIDTRNVMLARMMPLRCISNVNGEIHELAMAVKFRAMDYALDDFVKFRI